MARKPTKRNYPQGEEYEKLLIFRDALREFLGLHGIKYKPKEDQEIPAYLSVNQHLIGRRGRLIRTDRNIDGDPVLNLNINI